MNKAIILGRLTRDPQVNYSQGETPLAVCRFTVAVDRRVRRDANNSEQQTADFISCVAFGRQAEFIEKYFHQGSKICISGRIQTGSYTNKEGQRVYTTDIVAEEVDFADSKGSSSNNGGGYGQNSYGGQPQASRPTPETASADGFMNIPDGVEDEGLPFN